MRIECPACGAEYEVPLARMSPGRSVRCAKCSTMWAPLPKPAEPPPPPPQPVMAPIPPPVVLEPAQPEPAPAPATAPTPRRKFPAALALAWVASFAVLGAAGYAAVTHRTAVIHAWPPSARAYAWLGLAR